MLLLRVPCVCSEPSFLFHAGKDSISTVVFSKNLQALFVGAGNRLLKVFLTGRDSEVLPLRGGRVNQIAYDDFQANTLMVAAEQGAYISHDFGKSFTKIYAAVPREEEGYAAVTAIAKNGRKVFVGTQEGLFTAINDVWIWQRVPGIPVQSSISWLLVLPDGKTIFVASDYGIYKSKDGGDSFYKVFVANKLFSEESSDEEPEVSRRCPLHMTYEPAAQNIYVGTSAGIYFSRDKGESFSKAAVFLGEETVYFVCPLSAQMLYAATNKGVYGIDMVHSSVQAMPAGLFHQSSRAVIPSAEEEVLVATVHEIVRVRSQDIKMGDHHTINSTDVSSDGFYPPSRVKPPSEPSLRDIRTAAVVYNEVGPEKIEQWRKRAHARGFLPQVSVSYDTTVDIYQTTTTSRVLKGPLDWGVSFKWDLADFIWNPYQKDIDVRSRLNTQLRMEIISEVTRLYFERKKLLAEIAALSADDPEYTQKELRLEEISAVLDGYTGGWLSRQTQQ